ncbi:MAG: DNA integrity scanning protein DisA nucleotide-binding domain protein [Elusimicrobia bacterium]|nr:DNA integrity scanning protein DisA nucleotide-binding domain protein [Elusimicrobiota bacterium]
MVLSLLRVVGPADVLDIALVAVLIYALLVWFKRARAAVVAKGMLVVAGVYLFARTTGMVLTTGLFHAFFAIALVALLVIFQEELRSAFERIAVYSLSGGAAPQPTQRQVDMLVKSLGDMAEGRIGALVVLRGRDPLDRHLEGGWSLGGALSEPLLKSIFDFHSEGHDGAVIIEGERASRFGVRLPLSRNAAKLAGLGTRHAAALGLAELTDAACVVVSEERGVISVAEDGRLEPVPDVAALRARLERFRAEREPDPTRDVLAEFFRRNGREKLIAAGTSAVLWAVLVLGAKEWRHTTQAAVHLRNVPARVVSARVAPQTVSLTLSGELRDFLWLEPRRLAVRVDASQLRAGARAVPLSAEQVVRPPRLAVEDIFPDVVEVEISK